MDNLYYLPKPSRYSTSASLVEMDGISREQIDAMYDVLSTMPPLEPQLEHHFSKGVFARQLFLPAETVNVSKIHKHPSLSIIAKGQVAVASEFSVEIYEAGRVIVAPPGIQRVVYALMDSCWITVHENPTETRDIDELEAELVTTEYRDLPLVTKMLLENLR